MKLYLSNSCIISLLKFFHQESVAHSANQHYSENNTRLLNCILNYGDIDSSLETEKQKSKVKEIQINLKKVIFKVYTDTTLYKNVSETKLVFKNVRLFTAHPESIGFGG